jgi:hypothetical protein
VCTRFPGNDVERFTPASARLWDDSRTLLWCNESGRRIPLLTQTASRSETPHYRGAGATVAVGRFREIFAQFASTGEWHGNGASPTIGSARNPDGFY